MKKLLLILIGVLFLAYTGCGSMKQAGSGSKTEKPAETELNKSLDDTAEKDVALEPKAAAPAIKKKNGGKALAMDESIMGEVRSDSRKEMARKSEGAAGKPSGVRREAAPSASGLKAGFADDNKQFSYFVKFLDQFKNQAQHLPIDIGERIILRVKDKNNKSIANAVVSVYGDGKLLCSGKSYADGSFLFFPSEYDKKYTRYRAEITAQQNKQEVTFDRQGVREIPVVFGISRSDIKNVPLDILFILDTTGSMGEEINRLKSTIEIINLNIASLSTKPKIRFGMVLYKDRGDEYVTQVVPLTENLDKFRDELEKVSAGGGGDEPEDLQQALSDVINKVKWNRDGIRLSFIITDAPPHLDYEQKYTYVNAVHDARKAGIKIFSVGTGGLNIMGEYVLRQIAQFTYAKYIFLTYGEKGESAGGHEGSVSHHTGANFQTDKLESIIIRFTKEELSYLTDQPLEEGDAYFQATKIEDEKNEETLQKLFDMAIAQMIDYSTLNIKPGTPASIITLSPGSDALKLNAEYFTEQMALSLNKSKVFKMVERKDIQKILKELELSQTGLVSDENAVKVGKVIGAKMLITGKLYPKADNYEIFLKLLRVETGEVLAVNKLRIDKKLGLSK